MARRQKPPGNGRSAASNGAHPAQALEQIADQVAERTMRRISDNAFDHITQQIAEKVLGKVDVIAERVFDAVAERITLDIVDKIAASIAAKFAGRQTSDETAIIVSVETVDAIKPKAAAESTAQPAGRKSLVRPARRAIASVAGSKRQSTEPEEAPPQKKPRTTGEPETRRNPKRKASEAESRALKDIISLPDDLLVKALEPLSANDIENWDGWAELESEPAFFNAILQQLGVKDVTAKELISFEQWALARLPVPVFGLIFLFQYAPYLDDEETEDDEEAPIWFANQTTNNSCASVALLNIVMNADEVELGEKLQAFKESTKHISTPLRGHRIDTTGFIRAAHNSFVRRMDQLNADLCLANEVETAMSKEAQQCSAPRRGKRQQQLAAARAAKRKKKPDVDYGFHFIAYVPAHGFVWELDGMRTKPRKIGTLTSDDWTTIAGPRIQERIQEYGDSENGFSLLALCRSPLTVHRRTIATHAAAARHIRSHMQGDEGFAERLAADERLLDTNSQAELREFSLAPADIADAPVPAFVGQRMSQPDFGTDEAYALHRELVAGATAATAKYREEIIVVAEEEERVRQRKKDYTPALHRWMTKLAEKGVLEDVIKTSQ